MSTNLIGRFSGDHSWPVLSDPRGFISESASDGYIFEPLWAGDKSEKSVELSLDELLEIVQRNQIGTRTRYIVGDEAVRKYAP